MSQRKLSRKTESPAARNLRLVPPPKPTRKSRRRWWTLPPELRTIRKPKRNPVLEAYEEELALAALPEYGASAKSMCQREPERWNRRPLLRVLKRLRDQGRVKRIDRRGRDGIRTVYVVNEHYKEDRHGG